MGLPLGSNSGLDRTIYTEFRDNISIPTTNTGGVLTQAYTKNYTGLVDMLRVSLNTNSGFQTFRVRVTIDDDVVLDVSSTALSTGVFNVGFSLVGIGQASLDGSPFLVIGASDVLPYSATRTPNAANDINYILPRVSTYRTNSNITIEYSTTGTITSSFLRVYGGEI